MNAKLQGLLQSIVFYADGIYGKPALPTPDQATEIELRERIAVRKYDNYFEVISQNHSIPVMDREIDRFLAQIPQSGLILDVVASRGWQSRRLPKTLPDVGVNIVDFVRSNLPHARNVLDDLVGSQVALMHADATALPFVLDENFQGFDGVWTVQTFMHIPEFKRAVSEANRVLKPGGLFSNYSLNVQPHLRLLYQLLHKAYVTEGWVPDNFWLARASKKQKLLIEEIFHSPVRERWSEILFSPEIHLTFPGRLGSRLGRIDSRLSNDYGFLGWFARQRSFHCRKK